MLRVSLVGVAVLALTAAPAAAQTAADTAAIRQVALDYLEGWNRGDVERMERALHPDLIKRAVMGGSIRGMDRETLVGMTSRNPSPDPEFDGSDDIRILDIFQDVATVRVDFAGWVDHVQIARTGEEWSIVNVLWQPRR